MKYYVEIAGTERLVEIRPCPQGMKVFVDGEPHPVDLAEVEDAGLYSLLIDANSHTYAARFEDGEAVLSFRNREVQLHVEDERTRLAHQATGGRRNRGPDEVHSIMPGVVREVRVAPGEVVREGQALLILEAMKMENEIRATHDGVVKAVHVEPGAAVDKGAKLVTMGTAPAS